MCVPRNLIMFQKLVYKIRAVSGDFLGQELHIDHFELDHERVPIVADQIDLDLNPALLLSGIISVHGSIDRAEVTLQTRYAAKIK